MQGENRLDGKVITVSGWQRRSHVMKLKMLREFALKYGGDPHMRWFVVNQILKPAGVEQRDYASQAAAMLAWVQNNIYYTNEPNEQVQTPWRTIKVKTGDCDDSSLLLATFAESIRMPWRYAIGGTLNGKPYRYIEGQGRPAPRAKFGHIYIMLGWPPFRPKTWAAAEPTMKGVPLGRDVVLNPPGRKTSRAPSSLARHISGYGNVTFAGEEEYLDEHGEYVRVTGGLPQPFAKRGIIIQYGRILAGVLEGAITGVAITLVMRAFDSRK